MPEMSKCVRLQRISNSLAKPILGSSLWMMMVFWNFVSKYSLMLIKKKSPIPGIKKIAGKITHYIDTISPKSACTYFMDVQLWIFFKSQGAHIKVNPQLHSHISCHYRFLLSVIDNSEDLRNDFWCLLTPLILTWLSEVYIELHLSKVCVNMT